MTQALDPGSAAERDQGLQLIDRQQELRRLTDLAAGPLFPNLRDENPIDLRRYWDVLLRRKWTVLLAIVIAGIVGLVVTYNTTPLYRSALSLLVEPPTMQLTGFASELSLGTSFKSTTRYQKTQEDVLRSRALARRVAAQLGLGMVRRPPAERAASFLAELKNTLNTWIKGGGSVARAQPTAERARRNPNPEVLVLKGLSVNADPRTNIIHLGYSGPDPEQAASIVNAVAQNYISMNLERQYETTSYAERYLEERIQQVRANLEDSEHRLIAYAREREIINPEDKLDSLMQTLGALNQRLTQAETERIAAESEYGQALKGKGRAVLQIMNSEVVQALKARKGELEMEYQGLPKVYKADYPAKRQLRNRINELDQQIRAEIAAINESIRAGYQAKIREQISLEARVEEVKREILALRDRSTDYQVLKREVDTNRKLYNNLLQRMKEVGVISAKNNISIIDPAVVPGAPYKPDLRENLMLALSIGLAVGILLAFLFEHLDDTIKNSEEVEKRVQAPVLGVIPFVTAKPADTDKKHVSLAAARDPRSPLAEAARSLITSLSFSTAEGTPKTMYVTSSGPGEGKTTIATGIAIALARTGNRVLQIDADLRSPSLQHVFDLPNTLGLTNYLAGAAKPADIAQPTQIADLFVITSGPLPPNPMELLSGTKMLDFVNLVSERFDAVIIDGPPVIGLADAIVLSRLAQSTIFVATVGHTRYGSLEGAVKRLRTANTNIIGAVINRFDRSGSRYGYGYGYRYNYDYHYSYDYGTRDRTTGLPAKA